MWEALPRILESCFSDKDNKLVQQPIQNPIQENNAYGAVNPTGNSNWQDPQNLGQNYVDPSVYGIDPSVAQQLNHPVLRGFQGFSQGGHNGGLIGAIVGAVSGVKQNRMDVNNATAAIRLNNARIEANNRQLQNAQQNIYQQMMNEQAMVPEQDRERIPIPYINPQGGVEDARAVAKAYDAQIKQQLGQHASFEALELMRQMGQNATQPVQANANSIQGQPSLIRQTPQQNIMQTAKGPQLKAGLQVQAEPPMVGTTLPVINPDVYNQHYLPQSDELARMQQAATGAAEAPSKIAQQSATAAMDTQRAQTEHWHTEVMRQNALHANAILNQRLATLRAQQHYAEQLTGKAGQPSSQERILSKIQEGLVNGNISPSQALMMSVNPAAAHLIEWKTNGFYHSHPDPGYTPPKKSAAGGLEILQGLTGTAPTSAPPAGSGDDTEGMQ